MRSRHRGALFGFTYTCVKFPPSLGFIETIYNHILGKKVIKKVLKIKSVRCEMIFNSLLLKGAKDTVSGKFLSLD